MTDTSATETQQSSGLNAIANTAKIAAILAMIPTAMTYLPPSVDLVVFGVMVACSAITAWVPAPKKNKTLIALYTVVRIGGLGVKYAIPYVASHLVKDADTTSVSDKA